MLIRKVRIFEPPVPDCEMGEIIHNSRFLRIVNEISYVKNIAYWLVHMGDQ